MSRVRIECATPAQASAASAILRDVALWLEARGERNWPSEGFTPEYCLPSAERGELWIGWQGEMAVATMLLVESDPDFWPEAQPGEALYLHKLAVARQVAGQGLSQAMLTHAEAVAREAGRSYLRLDCRADRPKLRTLYQDAGFGLLDERTVYGWLHVARFEKRL